MNRTDKEFFIKKIFYKSKNRGCKENDLILGAFTQKFLFHMNEQDLVDFANILEQNDLDIYDWLRHKCEVPLDLQSNIMTLLVNFDISKI
jgi:antitoxin CptB